jgi:glutamate formiminotransferase/glutamate formiminotransferase/formiminotetrahydrofolate cyclodeaminase
MNLVDYRRTGLFTAFRRVQELAKEMGVPVRGSEMIGMLPRAALAGGDLEELRFVDFDPSGRILEERLG